MARATTPDMYPNDGSLADIRMQYTSSDTADNVLGSELTVPFRVADFALVPCLLWRKVEWTGELADFPGFADDWQAVAIVDGLLLARKQGDALMASQYQFVWPWVPEQFDTWRVFRLEFGADTMVADVFVGGGESDPPLGYLPADPSTWFRGLTQTVFPPDLDGDARLAFKDGAYGYEWLANAGGEVTAVTRAKGMIPAMFANEWELEGLNVPEYVPGGVIAL